MPDRPTSPEAFGELSPQVWPRNASRGDDGEVTLAGVKVGELAEKYGTPLFVIDEDDFRSRCRDMARAFGPDAKVHYASKAFLCGEIARWVADEGLSLDVCSGGELAIALHADFPAERIAMHGNNKSVAELAAGVAAGVGHVVLDSSIEIDRLDRVAGEAGVVQDVLIRLTVGVEAHTTNSSPPHTRTRSSVSRWPGERRSTQSVASSLPTTCDWSACTATSVRRSSTSTVSRWQRTA